MPFYVYIIIIIVVAVGLQILVTNLYAKKRLQGQVVHINQQPLTDEQKRLLTYGAILAYYRGENLTSLMPKEVLDRYQFGLRLLWSVTDGASAKATLSDLLAL